LHPKISFTEYESNFGSIISIWFSVAVIDVHKLLKHILGIFIQICYKINYILKLRIFKIFKILTKVLNRFNNYSLKILIQMKKINCKILFKFISLNCFISINRNDNRLSQIQNYS
jgi:hypothetical protein